MEVLYEEGVSGDEEKIPRSKCCKFFHLHFAEIASHYPDNIALRFSGSSRLFENNVASYLQLHQVSNAIAHYLRDLQLHRGSRVGIFLPPSADAVASILGILKSNNAFVTMSPDPDISDDRLIFYATKSECKLILTLSTYLNHSVLRRLQESGFSVVCLDLIAEDILKYIERGDLKDTTKPDDLAYIFFSSGSTGEPKGIKIAHRGLFNFMSTIIDTLKITPNDNVAQFVSLNFDASFCEIMQAIGCGASLTIVPHDLRLNLRALEKLYNIPGSEVTVGIFTPSMLAILDPSKFKHLRVIICTGEHISDELIKKWSDGRLLINGYGPSEGTIGALLGICNLTGALLTIKIKGIEYFLFPFNDDGTPVIRAGQKPTEVAENEEGEMFLSGDALALGYIDPSEEKFFHIEHPTENKRIRVYRTGDIARKLNGGVEICRRIDRQVKIYGRCVCPEEIEKVLLTYPGICSAYVTITVNRETYRPTTTAIIQFEQGTKVEKQVLYDYVRQKTMQIMLPSRWIYLKEIPRNERNKTNFTMLRAIGSQLVNNVLKDKPLQDVKVDENIVMGQFEKDQYLLSDRAIEMKPLTDTEEIIIGVWSEILDLNPGIDLCTHDNFFHLGGTSIDTVRLFSSLRTVFGRKLPITLSEFNHTPTVRYLARKIDLSTEVLEPYPACHPPLAGQSGNKKAKLFLLHSLTGNADADYLKFSKAWRDTREIIPVQAQGLDDPDAMPDSLYEIALSYAKSICRVQIEGPYLLMGWSLGGNLAYVVAQILRNSGHKVAVIAVDSAAITFFQNMSQEEHLAHLDALRTWFLRSFCNFGDKLPEMPNKEEVRKYSKIKQVDLVINNMIETLQLEKNSDLYRQLETMRKLLIAELQYYIEQNDFPFKLYVAGNKQYAVNDRLGWPPRVNILVDHDCLKELDHFRPLTDDTTKFFAREMFFLTPVAIFAEEIAKVANEFECELLLSGLKRSLQARYSRIENAQIDRIFDRPCSIESNFINLAIVKEKHQRAAEATFLKDSNKRDQVLSSYEGIYSTADRDVIELQNIFNEDSTVLVIGKAGIGKSTLCKYIAHNWARNQLFSKQFDFVFWITLRNINTKNYPGDKYDLFDVIVRECLDEQFSVTQEQEYKKWFSNLLKYSRHRVLFVLDGFDELSQEGPVFRLLRDDVIESGKYHVLVTSRPSYVNDQHYTSVLENIGFVDRNIKVFVETYFHDDLRLAESLIAFLQANPSVHNIAHVPINLQLICLLWRDERADLIRKGEDLTVTDLYRLLTSYLWRRYLIKSNAKTADLWRDGSSEPIENARFQLCQTFLRLLAFKTLSQDKVLIPGEDILMVAREVFNQDKYIEQIRDFLYQPGFINPIDRVVPDASKASFYFIHRTFQEFFSAQKWVDDFKSTENNSRAKAFFFENKFNRNYEMVWIFCAGLLSQDKAEKNQFVQLLDGSSRDVFGTYHMSMLIQCVNEARLPMDLPETLEVSDNIKVLLSEETSQPFLYGDRVRFAYESSGHIVRSLSVKQFVLNELSDFPTVHLMEAVRTIYKTSRKVQDKLVFVMKGRYFDIEIRVCAAESLVYMMIRQGKQCDHYIEYLLQLAARLEYIEIVIKAIEKILVQHCRKEDVKYFSDIVDQLISTLNYSSYYEDILGLIQKIEEDVDCSHKLNPYQCRELSNVVLTRLDELSDVMIGFDILKLLSDRLESDIVERIIEIFLSSSQALHTPLYDPTTEVAKSSTLDFFKAILPRASYPYIVQFINKTRSLDNGTLLKDPHGIVAGNVVRVIRDLAEDKKLDLTQYIDVFRSLMQSSRSTCYRILFIIGPDCFTNAKAFQAELNAMLLKTLREPDMLQSSSAAVTLSSGVNNLSVKERDLLTSVIRINYYKLDTKAVGLVAMHIVAFCCLPIPDGETLLNHVIDNYVEGKSVIFFDDNPRELERGYPDFIIPLVLYRVVKKKNLSFSQLERILGRLQYDLFVSKEDETQYEHYSYLLITYIFEHYQHLSKEIAEAIIQQTQNTIQMNGGSFPHNLCTIFSGLIKDNLISNELVSLLLSGIHYPDKNLAITAVETLLEISDQLFNKEYQQLFELVLIRLENENDDEVFESLNICIMCMTSTENVSHVALSCTLKRCVQEKNFLNNPHMRYILFRILTNLSDKKDLLIYLQNDCVKIHFQQLIVELPLTSQILSGLKRLSEQRISGLSDSVNVQEPFVDRRSSQTHADAAFFVGLNKKKKKDFLGESNVLTDGSQQSAEKK